MRYFKYACIMGEGNTLRAMLKMVPNRFDIA